MSFSLSMSHESDKLKEGLNKLLNVCGFFPSLWEGLGEGAKLDAAHKPSLQPSPKGRGRKTSNFEVFRTTSTGE